MTSFGTIPATDGTGQLHVAFGIDAASIDAWRGHLSACGVEIESSIADHKTRSAITEQVEMGVAIRMAVLETLAKNAPEPGATKQ